MKCIRCGSNFRTSVRRKYFCNDCEDILVRIAELEGKSIYEVWEMGK